MSMAVLSSRRADDAEMMSSMKKTTKTYTYKTDSSGKVTRECHTKVEGADDATRMAMRKMEERIRVIADDLDSEQSLRRRVEREKQDLQMQIISLSERLTEAEGGAECQLDINRKREAEMAKLRKMLEDVHMESEQSIHLMKKKHQEAMMEMQEQIEMISRTKEKVVKEKSKLAIEIESLIAQIEVLSSEKTSCRKTIERLEIQVNEYNVKMDNMSRDLTSMTSSNNQLKMCSDDSSKKLSELKIALETAGIDKNKISSQLRDMQSSMDAANRGKSQAESRLVALESQFKSMSVHIEELKEVKIELERQLGTWKTEGLDWKKKYENEARLRAEDVDSLKKKFGAQVSDLQDQLDALLSKMKGMEQVKTRLQSEIAGLVKDLEHSQLTAKEFQSRLAVSEKKSEELSIKLIEMTKLYEKSEHDAKVRGQDLVRLANDFDRLKMENEVLRKDKHKLEDDLKSYRAEMDSVKRQLHDADTENRKLAHDREELARAFKEADSGRSKAEIRVQELEAELKRLRTDIQRLMAEKEDENNGIRKKLMGEIESLTVRLHEAENRLKVEVEKIKKKMAITISELEMSLDAANKSNINLTNVNKTQLSKISELSSVYEECRRKLEIVSSESNNVVKKIQMLESECNGLRSANAQIEQARRQSEAKVQELNIKITEITQINSSLNAIKVKLEKEMTTITADYDDIARELKLADERANKAASDAQHFESLLRDEGAKLIRLDTAKKALETEVKSLTIKMEEIESTAISSSRRTIKQMEIRIEELESIISREKSSHVETTTVLHKKEKVIKELLLQSEEDRKNILILQESLDRLNEKIKMYKRQLEEQESISNSNIMRVKKFQRELENAEGRAEEAESSLNSFRSRQRVYAAAESSRRENVSDEVEREVVIKKNITNISHSANNESGAAVISSSYGSGMRSGNDYRAGSVYSRAGSVARAGSMARATSMARSGSVLRY